MKRFGPFSSDVRPHHSGPGSSFGSRRGQAKGCPDPGYDREGRKGWTAWRVLVQEVDTDPNVNQGIRDPECQTPGLPGRSQNVAWTAARIPVQNYLCLSAKIFFRENYLIVICGLILKRSEAWNKYRVPKDWGSLFITAHQAFIFLLFVDIFPHNIHCKYGNIGAIIF